jgi:hypothetical protein
MADYVSFPDGSGKPHVRFPQVPKATGKSGGVIRHKDVGLIPISDSDEPVSGHDRARVGPGPQGVAPPKPQDPGEGLPPEWFPPRSKKVVDHD